MPSLMWFRSDLRVEDNTALSQACRSTDGCAGLFVVSSGEWRAHDVAPVRVEFVLRTLGVLSADLARLNIPLIIAHAARPADVPAVVLDTAMRASCGEVFFNREYELNESRRDDAVTHLLRGAGITVTATDDQTILAPGTVRTREGRPFTVFTPFKNRWLEALNQTGVAPCRAPAPQARIAVQPSAIPGAVPGFSSSVPPHLWPAGEHEALARLRRFIEARIGNYKSERDIPALDSTSTLSPYLAVGAVSARRCLAAALEANQGKATSGRPGAAAWITELIWREFYVHVMRAFPRVCMHRAFKPATERIRWSDNQEHFQAWCGGRTGVPIVDAAMRQLLATGWMHNRLRMITAMYLTKDLFIDWRRGEKFFMQNLVDGFLASNNGGWQWSASTGTDAAPYFRIFNPISQSRACDPRGDFIRRYVPELKALNDDQIHDPGDDRSGLPPLARARLSYPGPLVNHSEARTRVLAAFKAIQAS